MAVVNIKVPVLVVSSLVIAFTDFCCATESLLVNESYCCDSDGNLVFSNFTHFDQSYLSIDFTEKHPFIHSAVETLCNLIFTSDVPQG